jgi:hypothetical protein
MNANGLLPYDLFSWNKAIKVVRYWIQCHGTLLLFTHKNGNCSCNYILCARWVLFITPDSSSSLPGCSIGVLPPPLLLINCLSCFPPGGPGPPPPGLTPFPSGSRHLPASSLATLPLYGPGEMGCLDVTSTVTFWPNRNVHCNILSMWHYDFLSLFDPIKTSKYFLSGLGCLDKLSLVTKRPSFLPGMWHMVFCDVLAYS